MKVLRSLFLDDLRVELDAALADRSSRRTQRLEAFRQRLRELRFLDPACGCGNFLVLSYRELRLLELETLHALHPGPIQQTLDVRQLVRVDVDQFHGIEIGEWPIRIAEVALWLMDHQMNQQASESFGQYFQRLPLRSSPHMVFDNALRLDWREILPPSDNVFLLGNPPFVGKKEQNTEQKSDMDAIWGDITGSEILDYVTCWYRKAAQYVASTNIRVAFVSTNSITQGEQVGVLWNELFDRWHMKIHFAHRTFPWRSEVRGAAHVHVVIIGFGQQNLLRKRIHEYDASGNQVTVTEVPNINPYLLSGGDTTVRTRTHPITPEAPLISYGSMMIDKKRTAGDDEGLILTQRHRDALVEECPELAEYIHVIYGGEEFLNGTQRWCLWLVDAPPSLIRRCRLLRERIEKIRRFRLSSNREQTRRLATTPTLFGENRQPSTPYILIPKVSSLNRRYIPIGFVQPEVIASGSALIVPSATSYHFGILSSAMHNAWMRCVAGRMKSDYQYSANIVFNNFIWPANVELRKRKAVEASAQAIVTARTEFLPPNGTATLADLYDPLTMPASLVQAHVELDRAVDRCYRTEPFQTDRERVEHLFTLYEHLTRPLIPVTPTRRTRRIPALG